MKHFSRFRPSPAMIVALMALFLSLGGVGYAAATITGKQIKNSSVSGSDIKNNSLTGSDVKESSLGKVPSATSADSAGKASTADSASTANSATTAGDAGTVSGQSIKKINYRTNATGTVTTIFSGGGLTIEGRCPTTDAIALSATTSKNDSSIYIYVRGDASTTTQENDLEGGQFDTGAPFNLLGSGANNSGNVSYIEFEYEAPDGSVASGTMQVDENGTAGDCVATGHVIVG